MHKKAKAYVLSVMQLLKPFVWYIGFYGFYFFWVMWQRLIRGIILIGKCM